MKPTIGSGWRLRTKLAGDEELLLLHGTRNELTWNAVSLSTLTPHRIRQTAVASLHSFSPAPFRKRGQLVLENGSALIAYGIANDDRILLETKRLGFVPMNLWSSPEKDHAYLLVRSSSDAISIGLVGELGREHWQSTPSMVDLLLQISLDNREAAAIWANRITERTGVVASSLDVDNMTFYCQFAGYGLARIPLHGGETTCLHQNLRALDLYAGPSGKLLAWSMGGDDNSGIVEVIGNNRTRMVTGFGMMPSFSPDGKLMAFVVRDSEVWLRRGDASPERVVSFAGGIPRRNWLRSGVEAQWCSCGHHFAVTSGNGKCTVICDVSRMELSLIEASPWYRAWL